MTARPAGPNDGPEIRATYEEYDLDGSTVAMIADPDDDNAWLQSDVVEDVPR